MHSDPEARTCPVCAADSMQLLAGEASGGRGAREADKDQFLEALSPRLRGSGWVLWKSSPERTVGI